MTEHQLALLAVVISVVNLLFMAANVWLKLQIRADLADKIDGLKEWMNGHYQRRKECDERYNGVRRDIERLELAVVKE